MTGPRVLLAAALLALVLAACGGSARPGPDRAAAASAPKAGGDLSRCAGVANGERLDCYAHELAAIVGEAKDPSAAVDGIVAAAYQDRGFLLANCHGLMHTVAREYAASHHVTLANLMDYLPQSNDPACAAGYAHGLVTGIAPEIERAGGAKAAAVCAAAGTRVQRYSCTHGFGHAFMRLNDDKLKPALEMCHALGAGAAPDCAQGAYHDYWFALKGLDSAPTPAKPISDPRALCATQPREFVRPCWYRAFIESVTPVKPVASAADIDALCAGLTGLQRQGCVTGAAMTGPADPRAQLAICTTVSAADMQSCIRATKVSNMLGLDPRIYPILIGDCEHFPAAQQPGCYRWLGKALAVMTDGAFGKTGCPVIPQPAARKECLQGVSEMNGALVTYS
jgi:hypothetical protein